MDTFSLNPGEFVGLESVITTPELDRRPARRSDYEAENRALVALMREMDRAPQNILQKLTSIALDLCDAQTAGVSLLTEDRKKFFWPAISGEWAAQKGGGTPREFGPCGTVLDRNETQLMSHPERHFTYLASASPGIEEVLLVPFYRKSEAVGTIWIINHDRMRPFDAEDRRLITSLGRFASTAYQLLCALGEIQPVAPRQKPHSSRTGYRGLREGWHAR